MTLANDPRGTSYRSSPSTSESASPLDLASPFWEFHSDPLGALATLLRFVPYVGIGSRRSWQPRCQSQWFRDGRSASAQWGYSSLSSSSPDKPWEPNLYGHATGLSPLSVVVAAIFWSALWGPIGLVLSTPVDLMPSNDRPSHPALNFLDLLLGDTQTLTLPQKFYQRALSGDADEILAFARGFPQT